MEMQIRRLKWGLTNREESTIHHYTQCFYLESPEQEEEGTYMKLLQVECRGRAIGNRYDLEQCRQCSP